MFERLADAASVAAAAQRLQAAAVPRGGIVAWLALNRLEMLALLVACEQRGAVLLPLNWRLATPELVQTVEHAQACTLLNDEALAPAADALRQAARWHAGPAEGVIDGDLLLVYTSGTTGEPKGALHTAAGMAANATAAIDAQGLDGSTRTLSVLPLFHVGGLCIQTLPTRLAGGELLLQPRFEPAVWFDAVEQWRPSTSLLVPAVMRALTEHPRWAGADLSSLRFVAAGSQIVPLHLIDAFHARGVPVAQVYGSTETGPVSLVVRPEEALAHPTMSGRPALGVQARLGADGEILLRAPNLMRGYHRSPTPAFDADGFFATGDLAIEHPGGWLQVVGRSKELIISGGENIHSAEIEQIVESLPGVAECAVVGVADARWGEIPVLVVVPRAGADFDPAALQPLLDQRLARFKHPRRTVLAESLPRTALGKVRKTELAQQLTR